MGTMYLKLLLNIFLSNDRTENMKQFAKVARVVECHLNSFSWFSFLFFPSNLGAIIYEQGKKFQKDVKRFKERY